MDRVTREERSRIMSLIRSKNTQPEMRVRRLVHSLGYRYRLHNRTLPGTPDLVFSGRRKVLFVNGCFWHQHGCKLGNRQPKSRVSYWDKKLKRNKQRDVANQSRLQEIGWSVLTIWECETNPLNFDQLAQQIEDFLDK